MSRDEIFDHLQTYQRVTHPENHVGQEKAKIPIAYVFSNFCDEGIDTKVQIDERRTT